MNWKSCDPGLEVSASSITQRPEWSRNGFTLSEPIYGATVTLSKSIFSKKVVAYIFEVLPMSPRLASAMMKWQGWFWRI